VTAGTATDTNRPGRFDVPIELGRLLAPWRGQVALSAITVVIATAASLVPPYVAAKAIDDGITKRDVGALDEALAVLAGAVVVYIVTSAIQTYASAWVSQRALASLRSKIFAHLQVLSPSFYDRAHTGELISRLTNDVDQLENLVAFGLTVVGGSVLSLVGTLVAMFVLDPELAVVALWVFPVTFIAVAIWGRIARPRFRRTRDTIGALSGYLQETLAGIRIVRSFGQERRHRDRFRELNERDGSAQLATNTASYLFSGVMSLLPSVGVTAILIVGGLQASHGTRPIGVVVAFVSYFQRLFAPLSQLRSLATFYTQGGAALDKINALLDEEPLIVDTPDARVLEPGPGKVRFEGVTFSYDGERDVLADVDATFAAGKVTAIVGQNGAGKSTLVSLISRFYEADAGRITIDGQDVTQVTLASLRRAVSFSLQGTGLLTGTVRANLLLGKPDASDEEIERMLIGLGGMEIVSRLPHGLDTDVGEAGATLSAGQRQVIALARTLLADPTVFILDEFTSGLDTLTEARLLDALDRVLQGRTRIVIAHRLGMVRRADHIMVMDGGRVVEEGDHATLMALGGAYAEMEEAYATNVKG
jgi:ABC-type multidrug transport system fused ATPase/permease subunit